MLIFIFIFIFVFIFIFSNECEILPDYQSCHVVQIYGGGF